MAPLFLANFITQKMTVVKQVVDLQKNKHCEVISQPIFSKIGIHGKLRSRPQYKICHYIILCDIHSLPFTLASL